MTFESGAKFNKQGDVTVAVKVLSEEECKQYFDKNIIRKGYQPIQITIDNQSKCWYVLSKDRISLSSAPPHEVAQKSHRSTGGRVAAYTVGGFLTVGLLFIPAIVDGVGSGKANRQMDRDFTTKGVEEVEIEPFKIVNKVIFVPTSEFRPNLAITIIDKETQDKLTFTFYEIK